MQDRMNSVFSELGGRTTLRLLLLAAVAFAYVVGSSAPVNAQQGTFIAFDAPAAVSSIGTFGISINPAGEIAGIACCGANSVEPIFLRAPDGTFTTFDAPGVGGSNCGYPGTEPSGINTEGDIVGFYSDANCHVHGFLRKKN